MDLEQLYQRLPASLQNAALSLEGIRVNRRRYGGSFRSVLADVIAREQLKSSDLLSYQAERLKYLFEKAEDSPFWAAIFREYDINTSASDPFDELRKMPVITKADVQRNADTIVSKSTGGVKRIERHTSGTTGSGLVFVETPQTEYETWATWWRYRYWHGISMEQWCGYFGGRSIVSVDQKAPPFWRINRAGKQVMFSAYHIKPDNAADYVQALNRYRVSWVHGYPSTLALLSMYILEQGLTIETKIMCVTTGAENLLDHQREMISKAFECKVHQHYGLAEAVANISERRDGRLTVDEDFAYVEFLDSNRNGSHRIVGTNWVNPAFPLFRYDTGDLAEVKAGAEQPNGEWRRVEAINGRQEDYVTLTDGRRLGRLDHIFKDMTAVREAQIYQPETKGIIVRIVKGSGYGPEWERRLITEIKKRIGEDMAIELDYVDELERGPTGKLKFVISEVS